MSNAFYVCNNCELIWNENRNSCPACGTTNIYFDTEINPQDHVEVWALDDDCGIAIEHDEDSLPQ